MAADDTGRNRVPPQVWQVREVLRREFGDLIDLDDVTNKSGAEREQIFLSRALAAFVVRHLTGVTSEEAAAAVTDGRDDGGIDAVGTSANGQPRLWLVQAKWSDTGHARVDTSEMRAILDGIRLIDEGRFDQLNARIRAQTERIRSVWRDPNGRTTVVVVAMRGDPLSVEVMRVLENEERRFNQWGGILDHHILDARAVREFVREDIAPVPVEITAQMHTWFRIDQPFEVYQGPVSIADVAGWYEANGDRLFAQNLRMSLGLTRVNAGMVDTLHGDPDSFFYFNNGIVVLCDSLEYTPLLSKVGNGPGDLRLRGASVVNGAQTVFAAYEATRTNPELAARSVVSVRVISLAGCPDDFAARITQATNTQNSVEPRDFVALDPTQARIRDDFLLSLQRTYVVRRGELEPKPDDGCTVDEAAVALACAHPRPELVARARKPDLLWERGSSGAYQMLFHPSVSAHRIWRSVLLVRIVRETLRSWRDGRTGRVAAVAEEGDLLAAHVVFRFLVDHGIDDPDLPWEDDVLARVPDVTLKVLARLAHHVDLLFGRNSYIGSTFGNAERCRRLAQIVLDGLRGGTPAEALPDGYRPEALGRRRQPNAVAVVVDAGRIADGTRLTFRTITGREHKALQAWLAAEPRRAVATWVNDRSRPLLWAADGRRYSPTGLVQHMWRLAGWEQAPVAVQGPRQWCLPGGQSLVGLAATIRREQEAGEEPA